MRKFAVLLGCVLGFLVVAGDASASSLAERTAAFDRLFAADGAPPRIMVQGFPWDATVNGQKHVWYRHMQTKADDLAAMGVTYVWFPPASRSVSPQGYMPGDYYDLGEGEALGHNRTLYGTKGELEECIRAFKAKGIRSLADIVINHRCGSHQSNGFWNVFHFPSGKMMWEPWAIVSGEFGGTGASDSGSDFPPAPDLDHANPQVQADIIKFLRWMRTDVGFDGWRFDYVKGYAAEYAKIYIEESRPNFAVGEYWTSMNYDGTYLLPDQNAHRQELCDWVDGTQGIARTFDFTTKGILQVACRDGDYWRLKDKDGKAGGLIGWWPSRAVTFIDNHDTGSTQNHWPFPGDKVIQGYAYVLTHPGTPCIFWDHLYAWGQDCHDRIAELAALRHRLGLNESSKLEILMAEQGTYVAVVDDKLVLRLGSGSWMPDQGWTPGPSGPGYATWVRP